MVGSNIKPLINVHICFIHIHNTCEHVWYTFAMETIQSNLHMYYVSIDLFQYHTPVCNKYNACIPKPICIGSNLHEYISA